MRVLGICTRATMCTLFIVSKCKHLIVVWMLGGYECVLLFLFLYICSYIATHNPYLLYFFQWLKICLHFFKQSTLFYTTSSVQQVNIYTLSNSTCWTYTRCTSPQFISITIRIMLLFCQFRLGTMIPNTAWKLLLFFKWSRFRSPITVV